MFIQVIEGRVRDAGALQKQEVEWHQEVEPGAIGYLGSTGGVTSGVAELLNTSSTRRAGSWPSGSLKQSESRAAASVAAP